MIPEYLCHEVPTMIPPPAQPVLSLMTYLENQLGLSRESERTNAAAFGDTEVFFGDNCVRIRLLRDRGDWFVDVAAVSWPDDWYDIALIKEHIPVRLAATSWASMSRRVSCVRTGTQ